MDKDVYEKIIQKKELSQLRKKDVELAFNHFVKRNVGSEEKIRLTRELLHKVFSVFSSGKLLNKKILDKKSVDEILKKHISTKERFEFYRDLYNIILKDYDKVSVIDLGAGINGLSYKYFPCVVNYVGVESVGQFVELMNSFFIKQKISGKAYHLSLFELKKVKELIKKTKKPRIVFLFKTVDSLEMLERDYSKKLLLEIVPLVDKVVVSFATKSLLAKKSFKIKRYWFENFVKENFNLLDNFELGGEKYFVFKKK